MIEQKRLVGYFVTRWFGAEHDHWFSERRYNVTEEQQLREIEQDARRGFGQCEVRAVPVFEWPDGTREADDYCSQCDEPSD